MKRRKYISSPVLKDISNENNMIEYINCATKQLYYSFTKDRKDKTDLSNQEMNIIQKLKKK